MWYWFCTFSVVLFHVNMFCISKGWISFSTIVTNFLLWQFYSFIFLCEHRLYFPRDLKMWSHPTADIQISLDCESANPDNHTRVRAPLRKLRTSEYVKYTNFVVFKPRKENNFDDMVISTLRTFREQPYLFNVKHSCLKV